MKISAWLFLVAAGSVSLLVDLEVLSIGSTFELPILNTDVTVSQSYRDWVSPALVLIGLLWYWAAQTQSVRTGYRERRDSDPALRERARSAVMEQGGSNHADVTGRLSGWRNPTYDAGRWTKPGGGLTGPIQVTISFTLGLFIRITALFGAILSSQSFWKIFLPNGLGICALVVRFA